MTVLHLVWGSSPPGIFKDGEHEYFSGHISSTGPKPGFGCYSLSTEPCCSLDVPDLIASHTSPIMSQKLGEFRMCFPFQPAAAARPSGLQASKLVGVLINGDKAEPSLDAIP